MTHGVMLPGSSETCTAMGLSVVWAVGGLHALWAVLHEGCVAQHLVASAG